jgi:TonB family protein
MQFRKIAILLSCIFSCLLVFVPASWAGKRLAGVKNGKILTTIGASGEPHRMINLQKWGSSAEYVNDDLGMLSVDTAPCIFVVPPVMQTSAQAGPTYEVNIECFDLVSEKEHNSHLYTVDANGMLLGDAKIVPTGEYKKGNQGFDDAAWNWISTHISAGLEKKIAAKQQAPAPPKNVQQAPPFSAVLKASPDAVHPDLIHYVNAQFSEAGRSARISGTSYISIVVDTLGLPQQIHTVLPLGYGLDEAALEAVEKYRFKPAMLHGQPIAAETMIEVTFHLIG